MLKLIMTIQCVENEGEVWNQKNRAKVCLIQVVTSKSSWTNNNSNLELLYKHTPQFWNLRCQYFLEFILFTNNLKIGDNLLKIGHHSNLQGIKYM